MTDAPVRAEVDESAGSARLEARQLVGEIAAETAQQLCLINARSFVHRDPVETAIAMRLQRHGLEPLIRLQ